MITSQNAMTNPLSQIPLTRSPFLLFPQSVTLPYNYAPLPSVSALPHVPTMQVRDRYGPDSHAAQLLQDIEAAKKRVKEWEAKVEQRRIREARKLAPGFLDTGVTMLTPTPINKPVIEHQTVSAMSQQSQESFSDQFAGLRFD